MKKITYKEFIQNIIDTRGQWNIPEGEYYESHHILPVCLGGLPKYRCVHTSKHKNIIWLYPQEHYIAHKLLAKENLANKNLQFAWIAIATIKRQGRKIIISKSEYANLKKIDALLKSISYTGQGNPNYGKKASLETRAKISISNKNSIGVKNAKRFKGHHHSAESKEKIRNWSKTKIWINNGKISKYIYPGDILPNGFEYGRLKCRETTKRLKVLTKKQINNQTGFKKEIYCIELNKTFKSIAEASKLLNISNTSISQCCHYKKNTAGGYHWKFKNESAKAIKIKCIELNKVYKSAAEASLDTGITLSLITRCCNKQRLSTGKLADGTKLHWKFVKE